MPREEGLTRKILALAWPAIATNVTTPLLSLVDVAVVGHIDNSVYIAAIALGGTIFNTMYWLFGFLRMGTSGMTAQAYGRADFPEAMRTLTRSLIISAIASLAMILLADSVGARALRLLDADGAAQIPAMQYFSVAVLGAPGVLATYSLSGWFLGMQTSKPILVMALVANTLNILLSLTFVFVMHWGIVGVGAATAISQWVSAGVGFLLMARRVRGLDLAGWRHGTLSWHAMSRFFSINTDIFLRTLCLVAVTLWFTHAGARQGVDILSANALLMQLFMLFSYFMDGFAFAGEALAGRLHGSGDTVSLRAMIRRLFLIGSILSLAATALYFLGGEWILSLLTDSGHVLGVAHDYALWAVAIPFAGFASFLWDGIYIGLTRTRLMLLTMLGAMIVFYGVYFLTEPLLHNHALWLAFLCYLMARGLGQTLLFGTTRAAS